jgi:hypothetical protein
MKIAAILLLLVMLAACSSRPVPKEVLLPDRMQKIIFDLIRADEFINSYVIRDSTINIKIRRIELYNQVFTIHKTNREEFYKSYKYYEQHPEIHKVLFDSLYAFSNRKKPEAHNKKGLKPLDLKKPR